MVTVSNSVIYLHPESQEIEIMRITEKQIRQIIREEILREDEAPPTQKAGFEKAEADGTLNVKKIADTLSVDATKLNAAVKAAKTGKRNASHNAVLGDVFVKLMNASPEDTVKAMNVLKAVSAEER